jgi:hypothetical protein
MIQYLANSTRPDLGFVASHLGQFTSGPSEDHWKAVKNCIRYIKYSKDAILKVTNDDERIISYCDADWGGDVVDRRSYSGLVVFIGDTPVAWRSKKQTCTSMSTQEAEYIAMSEGAKDLVWIGNLIEELGLQTKEEIWPIPVKCDSTSAIRLANNDMTSTRSKHIDLKFHYIRECVLNEKIVLEYVNGEENVADIFTKPLGDSKYKKFRDKLIFMRERYEDQGVKR